MLLYFPLPIPNSISLSHLEWMVKVWAAATSQVPQLFGGERVQSSNIIKIYNLALMQTKATLSYSESPGRAKHLILEVIHLCAEMRRTGWWWANRSLWNNFWWGMGVVWPHHPLVSSAKTLISSWLSKSSLTFDNSPTILARDLLCHKSPLCSNDLIKSSFLWTCDIEVIKVIAL